MTAFASAEKADSQELDKQHCLLEENILLKSILDSVPNWFMVLNDKRQIVQCNRQLLSDLGWEQFTPVLGKRPGDVLQCVHALDAESGCGTTEFCRFCGAVNAILNSAHTGKQKVEECRIMGLKNNEMEAYDLKVAATPIKVEEQNFTFLHVTDISGEKRRDVLQQIFFHDVINTAGALKASLDLINTTPDYNDLKDLMNFLPGVADQLLEEILMQKQLFLAESNELKISFEKISSLSLLRKIVPRFANYDFARDKRVRIDLNTPDILLFTDGTLLERILGNMLKNALEASLTDGVVIIGGHPQGEGFYCFWVENQNFIPHDVQMQIFKRSFSTKGKNRGLGTYSIKLLTERYLKGSVSFYSVLGKGTIFQIVVPIVHPHGQDIC